MITARITVIITVLPSLLFFKLVSSIEEELSNTGVPGPWSLDFTAELLHRQSLKIPPCVFLLFVGEESSS